MSRSRSGSKVGNDGIVGGAKSRARMSELVEGKGSIDLREYKEHFYRAFPDDRLKAQRNHENWCCRVKDNVISTSGIQLRPYQKEFSDRILKSVIRNDGQTFFAEWARQCLDKNTVVLDFDGSACRINDHDRAWKTGVKDAYELTVEGGYQITATDNHPFWSPEHDDFAELGELEENDLIGVVDGIGEQQWSDVEAFTGTYEKFVNVHRTDTIKLREPISTGLMRFLGLMIADGTGYEQSTDQSVKFTNTNRDYCEWVAEFASERWGVDPQWYEKGNGWDVVLSTRDNGATNPVNEAFRAVELDGGFPTAVFDTTPEMVGEFLRGMWMGDGSVFIANEGTEHEAARIVLSTGVDEVFARYVEQLLGKCGIESRVHQYKQPKRTPGNVFQKVVLGNHKSIRRFIELVKKIPGKNDAFDSVKSWIRRAEHDRKKIAGSHTEPTGEHVIYRRVQSIEYVGKREVWDVRYPGKDWFVAQNFVSHNSGKTETLASTAYAISVMFAPVRIGIFGPKQRQAHIMWDRIKERYNQDFLDGLGLEIEKYGGNTFKLSSGSVVQAITAGSGNIEGETFDLILIDETQKISRRMLLAEIWPMGVETNATKCCIGTPHFQDCWFREQLERLEGTPYCMIYDWRTPAKYSKNYRKAIARQLEQMSPESDEFRTQYELEWILEAGMFLTYQDWKRMTPAPLLAPVVRKEQLRQGEINDKWQIRAGLDLAKEKDSTVLTVTGKYSGSWNPYWDKFSEETIVLLDIIELQAMEYPDQIDVISEELNKWHADVVGVDSTGVGDPVTDILKRELPIHVEGIKFTKSSKHDLYKHVERKIKVEEDWDYCNFVIPQQVREYNHLQRPMRKMEEQWLDMVKEYKGSRMSVSAPDGQHDDYPDSAALSMWVQDASYNHSEKHMGSPTPSLGSISTRPY